MPDQNTQKTFLNFLVEKKVIASDEKINGYQGEIKISMIESYLLRKGITEEQLVDFKAEYYGLQKIQLSEKQISLDVLKILPYTVASRQKVIVFDKDSEGRLKVAMLDPANREIVDFLAKKSGFEPEIYLTTRHEIDETLRLYSKDVTEQFLQLFKRVFPEEKMSEFKEKTSELVDTMLHFAKASHASDIHLEPQEDFLLVRFRIDGVLYDVGRFPKEFEQYIVSHIKVLSNLRTDEHSAAQDGRFRVGEQDDGGFQIRVSIIPIYNGEKVVMRLLVRGKTLNSEQLGFSQQVLEIIDRNIDLPNGMILVTGPTGSGKTTTLYSVLSKLNKRDVNITTLEDPIEYRLPGVNQIQVNPKTNLTFAAGLRSILRQDPDIILVGEIRDEETAKLAINASMTGHLVLATLHTNSAATTLQRLAQMGVEPFLVASTVRLVLAQRLIRKICSQCNGQGCLSCHQTGYMGRTVISEAIEINEEIRNLIVKNASPYELAEVAKKYGMKPMIEDGNEKARAGITTQEEVLRVTRE